MARDSSGGISGRLRWEIAIGEYTGYLTAKDVDVYIGKAQMIDFLKLARLKKAAPAS